MGSVLSFIKRCIYATWKLWMLLIWYPMVRFFRYCISATWLRYIVYVPICFLNRVVALFCQKQVTWTVVIDPSIEMMGADKKLWEKLNRKAIWEYKTKIIIVQRDSLPIDSSLTTLLVCPVSSRLGSNAEHTMKGVQSRKNMILLLFHSMEPHVDTYPNSQEVLTDQKFRELGAIVDVVYSQSHGLYECFTNTNALNQLCRFLVKTL